MGLQAGFCLHIGHHLIVWAAKKTVDRDLQSSRFRRLLVIGCVCDQTDASRRFIVLGRDERDASYQLGGYTGFVEVSVWTSNC